MDFAEAINLLMWGCDISHPYKDVIDKARLLMHGDWQVVIDHVPREENMLAISLQNLLMRL